MDADLTKRLDQLRAHIVAVQNLLLSAIVATDLVAEGSLKATIEIAKTQEMSAARSGHQLVALRLNLLIDELVGFSTTADNDG
ncbi:MAG TPA: hypothetical protein VF463_10715 [Sphingobium sp.]